MQAAFVDGVADVVNGVAGDASHCACAGAALFVSLRKVDTTEQTNTRTPWC